MDRFQQASTFLIVNCDDGACGKVDIEINATDVIIPAASIDKSGTELNTFRPTRHRSKADINILE